MISIYILQTKQKEIGKVYDDAFTYIPQMLSKYLDPSEVEKLAQLGYKAMKAKVLKEGIVSYAELERLGLIVRDDTGAIVEIPESSIFYLVDKEGKPLTLDQMISRIPKTLDEFKVFEAQRRIEAGRIAQLPDDLKDALTSRVRMATLTPEEKAKIVTALKTNIDRHLERSKAGVAPENDLYFAGTQLLLLKQRATEWGDEATISWVNKTIEDLNTNRGIEINDNPKNPVVVELNKASSVKPEDKPKLKTIYVSSPEISMGTPKRVMHPGRVYKQWLPEGEAVLPDGKPSLIFTTKLSEDALASGVHSTRAQQLGYEYSMAVVSKHLANMFGEAEPTSFNPRFISINALENSFVTFENLITWANSDTFKAQVDSLSKVMGSDMSKTDIGMMILGGWLLKAKNHNLKIMQIMTPENQATLLREFNNIAFTTLRARYDGTPINQLDSTKLFQDTFVDRLARGTKAERVQALFGYDQLWTPESELNPLITLSPTKAGQVSEGVVEASAFWKQMQTTGKEITQLDRKINRYLGYQKDLENLNTARNKPDISEKDKKALDNKLKKIQTNLKKEKVTNLDKRIKELQKRKRTTY